MGAKNDPGARRAAGDLGAPAPRGTYRVSGSRGRASRDGLYCAGLPLSPARARPRRHLLECPAKLAAEQFPAFFHNDFLKLLTRIVPHFSPHSPPPAGSDPAPSPWQPGCPARQRRPAAGAPGPGSPRRHLRQPGARAPRPAPCKLWVGACDSPPARLVPQPTRPARTARGFGTLTGTLSGSEGGTLPSRARPRVPPSDGNSATRRAAHTKFAAARGSGPAAEGSRAAAGTGRTCWRRRRLQPARPRRARSARRRHPRAQRARALPLAPSFLIPAQHHAAAPRGMRRPALCPRAGPAQPRHCGTRARPAGVRHVRGRRGGGGASLPQRHARDSRDSRAVGTQAHSPSRGTRDTVRHFPRCLRATAASAQPSP